MKMRAFINLLFLPVAIVCAAPAFAQSDDDTSPEGKAFAAIEAFFPKINQGGDKPSDKDLQVRRDGGIEMARTAQQFVKDFANSKKADEAKTLMVIGLSRAALSGDSGSFAQLQNYARAWATNSEISAELKESACVLNYMAEWGRKNGQPHINEGERDGRRVYIDGLFAAADAIDQKENVFKSLLLNARSGYKLEPPESKAIAERVRKHPGASAWVKAEADKILSGAPPYQIGKPVDIKFTALDGRKIDVQEVKGKVVFIDFWATWCGPCVAALPALKATYDKYHDKGLEVIGINLDENKETLETFLKKRDIRWPQYFDGKGWNNEISFRYGINAVPTLWVIDTKGILFHTSPHDDEDGLAALFLTLSKK